MDSDSFLTPRKLLQTALARTSSRQSMTSSPSIMAVGTPRAATSSRFNLLPVMHTPPSRMLHGRVVNPFEPHLADRLHLPMIGSPSLFNRPSTPQNSSLSQFEWTIDELSSLGPANVEAHETQFHETPDPAVEARVQAAISSYFKEHSIVPSPIDSHLRGQKVVLSKQSVDPGTSSVRSGRKQCIGVAQTVLTFPPTLPPEVEDVLGKFLTFNEDQQQKHGVSLDESSASSSIDHEARDASLRRKLFSIFNPNEDGGTSDADVTGPLSDSLDDIDLLALSPAPISPEVMVGSGETDSFQQDMKRSRYYGSREMLCNGDISLSPVIESEDDSSFGALSPISKTSLSPPEPTTSHDPHHSDVDAIYRSTPEPSACSQGDALYFTLQQNESQQGSIKHTELTNVLADASLFNDCDTVTSSSLELSQKSQHSMTPLRRMRRKETRRTNRKNLSQSFMLETPKDESVQGPNHGTGTEGLFAKHGLVKELPRITEVSGAVPEKVLRAVNFYRTDSGFNEESQSNDLSDVSMLSEDFRSTPGKKAHRFGGGDLRALSSQATKSCNHGSSSTLRL
ncbi:protein aurora borealis [Anopheles cruzii]|uniref:protein aurora borealis n=1 Tax=Anopheles cruzii TaxID=68878 RepID=UPI0022EC4859|nr:protein aurora borealis [Anopheles cruzii]